MSKFSEAFERVEAEGALLTPASSLRTTADVSTTSAQAAELPLPASALLASPVHRSDRIAASLVSLLDPTSFEADQYRVLRHVVETMRKGANLQVVAVTSPGVGDGKTTTAINLAGTLAQSADARVLLVDTDLRRPAVARQLGLSDSKGSLVEALLDTRLTLEDTVKPLDHFNLSVLPAGKPAVAPYELLKSPRLEVLFDEARQRFDYIVLDTPPFLPVPDCRVIAKYVDGFLTVVAAHRTRRGELAKALDLMDPAKVVGLVFNRDDARRPSYYTLYAGSPRGARWRLPWRKP